MDGEPGAWLIDMNGEVVNRWTFDAGCVEGTVSRAKLLANGHVGVLLGGGRSDPTGVQEYDWDNNLVWEYAVPPGYRTHHDFDRKSNSNWLLVCYENVPEQYRKNARHPRRQEELYSDAVLEVTPDKDTEWEWHMYEHVDINRSADVTASRDWWAGPNNNTVTDWTHTNTIRALPQNEWYDGGDLRFKPGNVIMSLRQLDLVMIADTDTGEVVWEYTGDYKGGLSGQHESHMIAPGLPGEGNILIFDNGASPTDDLAHAGRSVVLEIDPQTKKVEWKYENGEQFHSNFTCSCARLPNGNTLINETAGSRIFEVNRDGDIVWEYVHDTGSSTRSHRYPYDFCSEMQRLDPPEERPVSPADSMRVER